MLVAYVFYALILIITLAKWHLPAMYTKGERLDREKTEAATKAEEEGFERLAELAAGNGDTRVPAMAAPQPDWYQAFNRRFSEFVLRQFGFDRM